MENSQETIGLAAQDAAAAAVQKTPHRVTLEHLEGLVKQEQFVNPESAPLLTLCVITVENGFTVIGKSAAADPDNFDADLGRKIARSDAIGKLWPLEGYLLRQRLHDGLAIGEETVQTEVSENDDDEAMSQVSTSEPEVAAATAAAPHLSRVSAEPAESEPGDDDEPGDDAGTAIDEPEDEPEAASEAAHDGGPPPSVGRIVHALLAAPGGTQVAPAIITAVREDSKVCLTIFRPMGAQATVDNVEAISNDVADPALVQNGVLWAWPPRV